MGALDDFNSIIGADKPAAPAEASSPAPVTSATTPAKNKSFWDIIGQKKPYGKSKSEHDNPIVEHILATSKWALESPVAQGANAVLGAPDNAIIGAELAASQHGNFGDIARGAWKGMTQPGQASNNVHDLEKAWHMPVSDEKTANTAQRVGQVAEDTALQSQSFLIPGLNIINGLKWGGKALRGIPGIEKFAHAMVESTPVDKALGYFNADHELGKIVTPEGINYMKSAKGKDRYIKDQLDKRGLKHTPSADWADKMASDMDAKGMIKPGTVGVKDFADHLKFLKGQEVTEATAKKGNEATDLLRWISDYQRDALFVLPFAHMKNLTVLAGLGPGGMATVAQGIKNARLIAKSDPDTMKRLLALQVHGTSAEYRAVGQVSNMKQLPGVVGEGLGKLGDWSNEVLTHYDNGLRLAVSDTLEKRGFQDVTQRMGAVRDIMGDYSNPSHFAKKMRDIGGNFPVWRVQIVPKAMLKAVKEQPKSATLYARANANFASDVTQPSFQTKDHKSASWDTAGPPEDAAKLADFPVGTAGYLTSGSTMGILSDGIKAAQAMGEGKLQQWATQEAEHFLPFGPTLQNIPGLDPYQDAAPVWARMAASIPGSYFPTIPSPKGRAAQLKRQGEKGKDLQAQLELEGQKKPKRSKAYQEFMDIIK